MSNTAPFLHIAYANNNTGTLDFTTKGGIERTYTGFYTDEYSTDSSDPTRYKWLTNAEFKNKVNTAAYANSADGTNGFTTVYPNLNLLKGTRVPISRTGKNETNQREFLYWFDNGKNVQNQGLSVGDTLTCTFDWTVTNPTSGTFLVQLNEFNWLYLSKIISITSESQSGHSEFSFVVDSSFLSGIANGVQLRMGNVPTDSVLTISNFLFTKGSTATPHMPSASEVKDSDYPQYIGFSNVANPTSFKDYEWTLLESVPGPTPPVVDNLYISTMPTVKSINLTYGVGTLTTKPVIWLSAKPKLDVNQVLWYKSEITGTDNSVGVYYSNLVGGANLDDGDSPLDNTVVSIVLNNKIVNVPRDLALKLELLSQTLNKRDNELAQLIADTNDRIGNIDLGSGQAGLNREILDRQNGDDSLGVRIDTVTGDVNDLKNNTQTKFTNIEKQLGGFSVQGTKNNSLTRPSIVFDYNAYGAILPDGSTDGGGRLYYQVPGDITYTVRELKFNYQTIPSFYDRDQIMIWEDSWSKLYGGFPWRDTIVTTTDIDKFYIDGMTTYYDYNGDLVIRGSVVLDGIDDWIGSMTNRGFKPDTVAITVASDLKSVKSIRFTGEMGVIEMSMNLGYDTGAQVQRIGRHVSFCGASQRNRFSSTGSSWTNLNDKIPYGLRPTRSFEFATNMFGNNSSIQYGFDSNGWQTFDQYPPIGYASKPDWNNR
ncbi:virion structural protein [Lactococcus phage P596]|uniref:Capsid and scaffold protein n=1 Tax=Lactococcus phage P596 TaxID=2656515 RepID=A0A5Q2F2G2_9CAUD|nr:virion structural protein [Lactococcus phage P596]QGF21142.1 hypothetical protein [Lactococcus phage P596]